MLKLSMKTDDMAQNLNTLSFFPGAETWPKHTGKTVLR